MPDIVVNELYKEIDRLQEKVKELEAERDADRRREYGYSQQTVDALTAERDKLTARVKELEEELDYERSRAVKAWELHQKCHDVMEPKIEELEAALTEERQRNRLTESIIRENEILTKRVMDLESEMREIGVGK